MPHKREHLPIFSTQSWLVYITSDTSCDTRDAMHGKGDYGEAYQKKFIEKKFIVCI